MTISTLMKTVESSDGVENAAGKGENTVGKGEIARYEQFLLFPQSFLDLYCLYMNW